MKKNQNKPKLFMIHIYSNIVDDQRFENYVKEFENNVTPDEFIKAQALILNEVLNSNLKMSEFSVIQALSKKKRFLMYQLIDKKPLCTCALAKIFHVSEGTISHHLKIMEKAGLIIGRKEGYYTRYYTKNSIQSFVDNLIRP